MKHKLKLKEKSISLREKGFSFREISKNLGVSKSTASLWTRNVKLSITAKRRLEKLSVIGRNKSFETSRSKRIEEDKEIAGKVKEYFNRLKPGKDYCRVACSLLYWGEGAKYKQNKAVIFMNADPEMIKYFLYTFRGSFDLDEKKFRALVHLHEYHNEEEQLKFWSKVTNIPLSQFHRSYLKKHTGKNRKDNYPGCISVRYFDNKIYKELIFTIKELVKMSCGRRLTVNHHSPKVGL